MVPPISTVAVLGGGSAGLIAAVTLKRRLPHLAITVLRSPELGIIGVGEGTTVTFPHHFFQYLRCDPKAFYEIAAPTWKMGLRFLWGPRRDFFYSFSAEHDFRFPDLPRNSGFYQDMQSRWVGLTSACMAHEKAFPRQADGTPNFRVPHAFHIENHRLVQWLETLARAAGVEIIDGTMRQAERSGRGLAALLLTDGRRLPADLFVDASGFRAELLRGTLQEPFLSYEKSLFCDRAIIAGWPRREEPIKPYTTAETMEAGWCWQIDHETWINRGYVYCSHFFSDAQALAELRKKNPRLESEPRIVKFHSGRLARGWVENVVGVGNAFGFVEPLEATALALICVESRTLADCLLDSVCAPAPTTISLYNELNTNSWDEIRDFLAIHYAFNTRLETPFWRACRAETDLGGAGRLLAFYRENGPSALGKAILLRPTNQIGVDGFLALLCGQVVPHHRRYEPAARELEVWRRHLEAFGQQGAAACGVEECLTLIRRPDFRWS